MSDARRDRSPRDALAASRTGASTSSMSASSLIFAFFAATLYDKGFLDPNNLLNIVRQTAMIAIMAVA